MKTVLAHPSERLGLPDALDGMGGLQLEDSLRRTTTIWLPTGRTTGQAATSARILGGFDFDAIVLDTDDSCVLNRGTGILPYLQGATLNYGYLQGDEGVDSVALDFSSAADGAYSVYVRATLNPGESQNRVFWNPSGAPAAEFVDHVNTRNVPGWEAVFQDSAAAAPGQGEWVKIYEIVIASSVIHTVTDFRHLYFEGSAADSYQHEWGDGANDRAADRSLYGVQDLHWALQAIRRQLDDIIGKTGWYKKTYRDLNHSGWFVTVDKPGVGGDGTYATLDAAIIALNSANGGVILLRAGTYSIGAAATAATESVRIFAVEDGVVLENGVTTGAMVTLNGDRSAIIGCVLTEGGSSSGKQVTLGGKRAALIQCEITGQVLVNAASPNTVIDGCILETAAAGSAAALTFTSGSASDITIRDSTLVASASAGTCLIITSGFGGGNVVVENTRFKCTNSYSAAFVCASAGASTTLRKCLLSLRPFTASTPSISYTNGFRHQILNCEVVLETGVGGVNIVSPVLNYDDDDQENAALEIDSLSIDFSSYLPNPASVAESPIYIHGYDVSVRRLKAFNIRLPNAATAANLETFIELDPRTTGQIKVQESNFYRITSEGSGSINASVIGQASTSTGSGRIAFSNTTFDGATKTYRNAADTGCLVRVAGAATHVALVNDCELKHGTWKYLVNVGGGFRCLASYFICDDLVTDLDEIIHAVGTNAESLYGMLHFSNNTVFHRDVAGSYAVFFSGYHRANITDNIVANAEDSAPPVSIRVETFTNLVITGNSADNAITTDGSGAAFPAAGFESNENLTA
jgi:hypothetical protein